MNNKTNNRINNIINNLKSDNTKKVISAIKQLRKHGKSEAIYPLIEKLNTTNNDEIKREITSLLFDLKDQSVVDTIITAIKDKKFTTEKAILISIFWQSSLDGSQHITTFVKEAIEGDYITGIEVLSVIDNFDATFQETEIEDLKYDLEEAIETTKSEKSILLNSIKLAVNSLHLEF